MYITPAVYVSIHPVAGAVEGKPGGWGQGVCGWVGGGPVCVCVGVDGGPGVCGWVGGGGHGGLTRPDGRGRREDTLRASFSGTFLRGGMS